MRDRAVPSIPCFRPGRNVPTLRSSCRATAASPFLAALLAACVVAPAPASVLLAGAPPPVGSEDTRSPRVAQRLSIAATVVPVGAGLALGLEGSNQALAGWLVALGGLAGPGTGLAYGRCYGHALVGVGLRTAGFVMTAAGVGLSLEVGGGGGWMWAGGALYATSTLYDILRAGSCTASQNGRRATLGAVSLRFADPRGRPGIGLTVGL